MSAGRKPRPVGRPVTTERGRQARTRVTVSLSPAEAESLERAASDAGETVATYIRDAALRAAKKTPAAGKRKRVAAGFVLSEEDGG